MWDIFFSAFITFFVVIDPIGIAPVFASLTDGTSRRHQRLMAFKSVAVAAGVLLTFAFLGNMLFQAIGVSLDAFRVAGGVMLFSIALEMVFEKRAQRRETRIEEVMEQESADNVAYEDISVFPMAIPLIAGPGAIAAIMLDMSEIKVPADQAKVFLAMGLNLLICLGFFLGASYVIRLVGATFASMITRILGVILAALSVQLIFDGIRGAFFTGKLASLSLGFM